MFQHVILSTERGCSLPVDLETDGILSTAAWFSFEEEKKKCAKGAGLLFQPH